MAFNYVISRVGIDTKGIIRMGNVMDKVHTYGQMEINIQEFGREV